MEALERRNQELEEEVERERVKRWVAEKRLEELEASMLRLTKTGKMARMSEMREKEVYGSDEPAVLVGILSSYSSLPTAQTFLECSLLSGLGSGLGIRESSRAEEEEDKGRMSPLRSPYSFPQSWRKMRRGGVERELKWRKIMWMRKKRMICGGWDLWWGVRRKEWLVVCARAA